MTTIENGVEEADRWADDALDRKEFAQHLTRYLLTRVRRGESNALRPFTLAVDADWGVGKTFFVDHWSADLQESSPMHLTLKFDAWSADYVADPVVSFMSEFKACIDGYLDTTDTTSVVRRRVTKEIKKAFSGMRRAFVPTVKEVVKVGARVGLGLTVDNIMNAYHEGTESDSKTIDLSKEGTEAINKSLDTFFTKMLEEQIERRVAIDAFRLSIETALADLAKTGKIQAPMFVFIDELDRCRPDFAIALLEGVKHLFSIPGVCFVVSTNLAQLSASVKAVYGATFNSDGYLHRFFDAECNLPPIPHSRFAALVLAEYPELGDRAVLGLPAAGLMIPKRNVLSAADVLSWVADTFVLDLRSQRKLAEMIIAAAAGIPSDKHVYLLFMASLCAIRLKNTALFDELGAANGGPLAYSDIRSALDSMGCKAVPIRCFVPNADSRNSGTRDAFLAEAFKVYYHGTFENLIKDQSDAMTPYPNYLHEEVVRREMPSTYTQGTYYPPSTAKYFALIRTAGHLVGDR